MGARNIIPKGAAHPQAAFTFIAWLAGYNNATFTARSTQGRLDARVAGDRRPRPPIQAWLKANPWLNVFVDQMSSPLSATPKLTATSRSSSPPRRPRPKTSPRSSKTPQQALAYIDQQANSAAGG